VLVVGKYCRGPGGGFLASEKGVWLRHGKRVECWILNWDNNNNKIKFISFARDLVLGRCSGILELPIFLPIAGVGRFLGFIGLSRFSVHLTHHIAGCHSTLPFESRLGDHIVRQPREMSTSLHSTQNYIRPQ
jgi:hypothetical protein